MQPDHTPCTARRVNRELTGSCICNASSAISSQAEFAAPKIALAEDELGGATFGMGDSRHSIRSSGLLNGKYAQSNQDV